MPYAFSLPTKSDKVPVGPAWIHEIKHDGYRMLVIRDHDRVRLISRGGHDWAKQFLLIIDAALKLRQEHLVIDGEAVVLVSMRWHRAGTTSGRSSMPSICSPAMVGIAAHKRSRCARPTSPDCSSAASRRDHAARGQPATCVSDTGLSDAGMIQKVETGFLWVSGL
jgi:hypothetical protein